MNSSTGNPSGPACPAGCASTQAAPAANRGLFLFAIWPPERNVERGACV
nr:MAG TPA: hypothetical protein [Caudoviricetes sp.]DAW19342.1 MAG TPA: hypothetical protein [Caudoviricetes sp.]